MSLLLFLPMLVYLALAVYKKKQYFSRRWEKERGRSRYGEGEGGEGVEGKKDKKKKKDMQELP